VAAVGRQSIPVLYLRDPAFMKKRFLVTTVVAITLLLGPCATVLVAGLCKYLQSNQNSCDTHPVKLEASHGMDHMQMEPEQSCTHCAVHSRLGNTGSLQRSSAAKRLHELTPIISESPSWAGFAAERWQLPSRAHGPPGDESSKHVLISVFRI